MKRECMSHTKMKRLCRRLDIPLWQGAGILESLWHIAGRECPCGNIGRLSNEDIALAMDYRGDEEKLIAALIASGWLDTDPVERLWIHDWWDHADDHVHRRVARMHLYFQGNKIPKMYGFGHSEKARVTSFYETGNPTPPNGEPTVTRKVSQDHHTSNQYTSNQQPVTSNQNSKRAAAAANLVLSIAGGLTKTLAAVRRRFPTSDKTIATQIANAARSRIPDATDAEIADAIERSWKSGQQSAALFLRTVPETLESMRIHGRDSPFGQQAESECRAHEAYARGTSETRAELRKLWPELAFEEHVNAERRTS